MTTDLLERSTASRLADPAVPLILARWQPEAPVAVQSPVQPASRRESGTLALRRRVADVEKWNLGVDLIGEAPLALAPILLPSPRAVVTPAAHDPHFKEGALGMPWSVRRRIRRLARSGLEFDTFYLLHEIRSEAYTVALRRPDLLVSDLGRVVGQPKSDPVAQYLVNATSATVRYGGGAAAVAIVVPLVAVAAVAAAASAVAVAVSAAPVVAVGALCTAAAVPAIGLDPVLIGAVTAEGDLRVGEPAAFFRIASWR
jgi:hypothetical protein